jgi:hypothetical protein
MLIGISSDGGLNRYFAQLTANAERSPVDVPAVSFAATRQVLVKADALRARLYLRAKERR